MKIVYSNLKQYVSVVLLLHIQILGPNNNLVR